uniref:Putative secreted protein n=1 Tax=Rhipicephalus microplus TaxID=6941 RepID=A0A6M2DC25_RHIMP
MQIFGSVLFICLATAAYGSLFPGVNFGNLFGSGSSLSCPGLLCPGYTFLNPFLSLFFPNTSTTASTGGNTPINNIAVNATG